MRPFDKEVLSYMRSWKGPSKQATRELKEKAAKRKEKKK